MISEPTTPDERAAAARFETLVVTLDCPVGGNRERDFHNRFSLPYRPPLPAVFDAARRVSWLAQFLRHGVPEPRNLAQAAKTSGAKGLLAFMDGQLDPSVTWEDVREVRRFWKGRLVVKGVLSPQDVADAINVGADGIVVSSHGGRQFDAGPRPLFMLPHVAEAAAGRLTLMLDGGVRRGSDVLKALALGADAVLLGRPTLFGVAAAGEPGARRVLDLLAAEVDRAMALAGCRDLDVLTTARLIADVPAMRERRHAGGHMLRLAEADA